MMNSMKAIISGLVLTFCFVSAAFSYDRMPNFYVVSDNADPQMSKTEAVFQIHVLNVLTEGMSIRMSANGAWKTVTLDEQNSFELKVVPGTYNFQFYLNSEYLEVTANAKKIESQHVQSCNLYFDETEMQNIHVKKPVVYFHTKTDLPVELTVVPANAFVFTYPQSEGTWKGIAKSNGSIEVNGVNYPYLFWEAEQNYVFKSETNGYKVAKAEVIPFLEKKLTELGFNQQEKTDFITWWGPQLTKNETSFVQFSIDEKCDPFASMNCTPAPQATRRVYIQIAQWDSLFEAYLNNQTFTPIAEVEFSILEWGGFTFELPEYAEK